MIFEGEGCTPEQFANLPAPVIAVAGLRALAGPIAHAVLGEPSERLSLIAVTGTNGKTSCSQWIAHAHPRRCAIIGTPAPVSPRRSTAPVSRPRRRPRWRATWPRLPPPALQPARLTARSASKGRMNGAHVDIAAFTNLTRDHLDYHGTMEAYAAARNACSAGPGCGGGDQPRRCVWLPSGGRDHGAPEGRLPSAGRPPRST